MITATALVSDPFNPSQVPLPFPRRTPLLPVPVEHGDVGELRHRCARFAQVLAEAICGTRPVRQLGPWLSPDVYEQLCRHVKGRFGPGVPARSPRVVSVHVSRVNERSAEVTARIVLNGRSHAIAIGLHRQQDSSERLHWRCTAAEWAIN
ncbi:MAG TPA: Rv3235 family protein [Aeromicrobium sp.]|nr:Rv3235 family protein [Aeromicrobium sp.]